MNNLLERKWEHLWPAVRYCPGIYLERLRKSQKNSAGYLVFGLKFERMIHISRVWHQCDIVNICMWWVCSYIKLLQASKWFYIIIQFLCFLTPFVCHILTLHCFVWSA